MTKANSIATVTKIFGKQMVFNHCYYVAEELLNGKRVRVSKGFAFQADAAKVAKEMARKDHGKFVVIAD